MLEILETLSNDWASARVGVKISPTLAMGGFAPTAQTIETYDYLWIGLTHCRCPTCKS